MLKNFLLFLFPVLFVFCLFTGSMPEPSNPPTGNTGAPGETACMLSGCHSGGTFTGTVEITGVPDTVFANQTYNVTLTNKSNAVRSGFQLTVLDSLNKFMGTLVKGTGVSIAKDNSNGRTYARQSTALFLSNGEASWNFQWKAPASSTNENFTFYFTSMCADGNGNNSKDNSIKNIKRVIFKLPVGNSDLNNLHSKSYISIQDGNIFIHDEQNRVAEQVQLIDLNGNIIFQSDAINSGSFQIHNAFHGIYFVQYRFGSEHHSDKVFIQ